MVLSVFMICWDVFFYEHWFWFKAFAQLSDAHKVEALHPFTKDDLSKRGIIDLFFDLDYILQLYPSIPGGGNIPKIILEQLKCKKEQESDDIQYKGWELKCTIKNEG